MSSATTTAAKATAAASSASSSSSSSSKRRMLLVAATDKQWAVMDETSSRPLYSAAPHTDQVQCAAWSANNKFVTTGGLDGKIVIASVEQQPSTLSLLDAGPQQPIHTLAFSKNSNTLAYGDGQGVISLFDLSKKHVSRTINGFNAAISSLSYDKGSEQLAFGDTLGNVGLYNALEDATSHLQRGPSSAITQVAFSRARRNLVAVSQDGGGVNVFDTTRSGHVTQFKAHTSKATGVAFYPNDKLLLSSGYEGTVAFYDLLHMKSTGEIKAGTPLTSIALRGDGTRLAVGCLDGTVQVYDIRRRDRPIVTVDTGTSRPVVALSYQARSPDRRRSHQTSGTRAADTSAVSSSTRFSGKTPTSSTAPSEASHARSLATSLAQGTSTDGTTTAATATPSSDGLRDDGSALTRNRLSSIPETGRASSSHPDNESRRLTTSSHAASQQFRSPASADSVGGGGATTGFQSLQTPARSSAAAASFRSKVGFSGMRLTRDTADTAPPKSSLRREVPMSVARPQRQRTGPGAAPADRSFAPSSGRRQEDSTSQRDEEQEGLQVRGGERERFAETAAKDRSSGALYRSHGERQQHNQEEGKEGAVEVGYKEGAVLASEYASGGAGEEGARPEVKKPPFYLSQPPTATATSAQEAGQQHKHAEEQGKTRVVRDRTQEQRHQQERRQFVGEGVATAPTAAGLSKQTFEAMQSKLLESVRGMVDAAMVDLRFEVQRDVHNMHLEMFRQFDMQKRELETTAASLSVRDEVLQEMEQLREENQQLRLRLDAQNIANPRL